MTGLPGPVQQGGEQQPAAVNAPSTPPLPTGIFEMPIQPGGSLDLGPLDRQSPDQFRFRSTVDSNDLAQLDAYQAERARRQGEAPTIDDLIEADRQQENNLIALHFREAAKANPDIAGEAQRLGVELEKMGAGPLRPIVVERNIDKMRQILAERRALLAAASVDSPTIRRQMTDPDFARIASDQTQQLGFFEGLGKNWTAGRLGVQRGMLGDRFRRGIGTESDLTELERVQEELAKLPASSGNILNGLLRLGGQFREILPRALVAAGAGAGTAVAAGQLPGLTFLPEESVFVPAMASVGFLTEMWASSAKQQSGAMYLDMVKEGFDPYASANISGAFGIVGGALDVVGFGSLVAPAKNLIMQSAKERIVELLAKPTLGGAAMAFGKNYGMAVGGELGTELLQTVNEIIAKEVARPSGQPRITPEELGQQLGDTIVETFNMTAIFGGLAPSARFMSDRSKVGQGKLMAQTIQQFLTKADEVRADWTKRNGEAFGEATEEIIKATGAPGTFYVEASKVGDILRQSDKAETGQGYNPDTAAQVDAEIPGFSEAVAKAEAEGGDVEIPAKLFVQKFGDTALAKALAPHLRGDPNGLSMMETEERDKLVKKADDKAERAMLEELAAVQDNFQKELAKQATGLTPAQNRNTAAIYRLMVEQIAREDKIPVAQAATLAFGRMEEAATGEVLNQPSIKTDTPEFRAWFGESKVVDDAGRPLVVYHGTPSGGFVEFDDTRKRNLDAGFLGRGFYFTSRPDVAGYYANSGTARSPAVMPVYVALQNPFRWGAKTQGVRALLMRGEDLPGGLTDAVLRRAGIERGAEWTAEDETRAAEVLRDELRSRGFDGVIAEVNGGVEVVAFDAEQIKSVNNRGTFDPNDPNILRQPGRGGFYPKRLAALFDSNSDPSTVVHELTHWHVEMMARLAANGSQFGTEMFGTLLKRWDITREQYDAMTVEQRRPLLEDISYNAEEYFATGQAPSSELRRLFEKIRSFMLAVYTSLRTQLDAAYRKETGGLALPAMTPELRGYFDRMLASREAIATAEADREMAALFMDEDARKAAGVTDEKWAAIQKLDEQARDEAMADLAARAVRGLGAFDGARMRTVKAMQQKLKATRAKVREQAEKDVRARPVYAVQDQIRYGEAIDEQGNAQSSKLDTARVRDILGEDTEKLTGMTKAGGVAPDLMASMFGFSTGEAMLREILNAPPLEAAIEAETNKRMEADHSELADPKKMQQAVLESLHGEARGKLIASELKALLKATAPTQSMLRAAKEAARQRLQDTPVGQISARSFAAAASRAARAARDALASGDVQEAIDAQRQYLFQNELARQSIAIEKEVDRFLDGRVAQVFGKDEDLLTTRNMDVVNVARGLLGEHDLSTVKQYDRAMSYLATLKDRNPEAEEKLRAFVEPVAVEAKPWRQLTLERFRALASATDALWHESKRGQEFRTYDGELLLRSTVRERLIEAAQAAGLDDKKAAAFGEEASRWSWADIKANLTRIEQWTITMDGGKEGGVWHRYVYRTVAKAYNNYLDASLKEVTYWRDTLAEFDNLNGPEIDAAELGEGIKFRNREHLLGTIVHIGNESNLTNVVLSEGWGELQQSELASAWGGKKSVLVTNLWKFINRALRDGHLTRKDLDTIQTRIWDHNEKVLKPLLDDTNREVYGTYVATIKPTPFAVEIGGEVVSYRGGYVPSKVDPNAPGNASLFDRKGFDAIMDGEQQFHSQFASVPRGSTIARKENVVRKRVLSLKLQGQHVDEVLRFGHIQPALTDVAALFRRGPLADFLNRTQPAAIQSIVAPALERVARNRIQAPMAKNARVVELAANALRRNASAAYLGFSIKNYLQQYTGVIQSLNYVSAGRMWGAFWSYLSNKTENVNRMFENSAAMRNSLSTKMQEVQDEIALLYDPSSLTKVRQWSNRYMMVLQRIAQFQVNTITWNAAFDEQYAKLLPKFGPDKAKAEAVERADSIVRRSQGSRTPLDVANFSAGNAVMQLFTQFQDFPNLIANQIMEAKGVKAKAAAIALSLLLPTLASGAIALGLAGGRVPGARTPDGDDDRDGRWDDEAAAYLFGEVMRGTGSLLPIIGAPLMERMFGGSSRAELAPFPSWGIGESMFRQVARTSQRLAVLFGISEPSRPTRDGAWSPADARDWSIILGVATGLPTGPVGRAWSFAENVEAGRSEASGAVRTILGILNGR